ncbi:MAG TPA: M50 family metallopeptidase [Fimbriimonadaceae bacterium]|nr:M50 family metallopeptidase [Fimbriimonadaceae bacterium]
MPTSRSFQMQLLAAGVSLALWAIPGASMILLPLEYLNTHIHELCHALAALATGGTPWYIHVYADGSGATPVTGGSGIALATSGYVGAAVVGGIMLVLAHTQKGARASLWMAAGFLTISMVLWVRGDLVGILSGIFWIALLGVMAKGLKGDGLLFAAQFLGIQQCLRSVQSLYVLLHINATSNSHNDAEIAEQVTGIPSLLWALLWCAISVAWMVVAIRIPIGRGRATGREES